MAKGIRRRVLDDRELKQLEAMARIRLPMEHIAAIFGVSKDTLEHMVKKNDAVRSALEQGRAFASMTARRMLYSQAVGAPAEMDRHGNIIRPAIEPDFKALKFWCQSQEGFTTRIDIGNPDRDGADDMTDEELDKRTARSLMRLATRQTK